MTDRIRVADLLGALSIVADLGYGFPAEEAMRSCLLGTSLARTIGLPEWEVADTFYTSLLVHVGCVTFSHEVSAVFGDEHRANRAAARTNLADPKDIVGTMIPEATRGMAPLPRTKVAAFMLTRGLAFGRRYDTSNCEVARETARRIGLREGVRAALYEVHEWWNGRGAPRGLGGEEIARPARIARLAIDAALFHRLGGTELAVEALRERAGAILDPSLVHVFVKRADAIAKEAEAGDPRERILEVEPDPVLETGQGALPRLAEAFGDLADMKTPYTHGHSREVARLAKTAARTLRLDAQTVSRLHLAALLHDVGRVGIPNSVWEKPGPLTKAEWEQVRMHPYHSERILATSSALAPLAAIAGRHHERLDGSGYHRQCNARDISPAGRVLAAADTFQAMTQRRAHREALTPEQAAEHLSKDVRAGRFERDAVAAVLRAAGDPSARLRRDARPAGLSQREIEVLRLITEGCSNQQVAERLFISRRTAEHHVQHIYTKIGVSSRAAVTLFALEHGLLPPSGHS